jgi:hypothetical protein
MPLTVPLNCMLLLLSAVVNPAPQATELSQLTIVPSTFILMNDEACACGTKHANIAAAVIPSTTRFI